MKTGSNNNKRSNSRGASGASEMKTNLALLEKRAELLAAPVAEDAAAHSTFEVIEVELAGERYALDLTAVHSVVKVENITSTPGASPILKGVINVRGKMAALFDLARILQLAPSQGGGNSLIGILFAVDEDLVGIGVERIVGIERRAKNDFKCNEVLRSEILAGVTPDGISLLDGARLMDHLVLREMGV